jgi:hypothetical protein
VLRFLRRQFGRYVDDSAGYSVRVKYNNFPGMDVIYREGSRVMVVFAEIMANLKDLQLDLRTVGLVWDPPYDSEAISEGHRTVVLNRILTGLKYLGYNVTTIGRLD